MPTIDVSLKDLQKLIGKPISIEELEDQGILYVKGEIDGFENDEIKVDCKETNRPDLWSTEGIARQIAPHYTKDKGLPNYKLEKTDIYIEVSKDVKNVRPYIVGAIAKNIKITDEMIKQMIQIQEKVCTTYGRKRQEAAIGIYDYDKIKFPLYYKGFNPESIKFIPLGFRIDMTLQEILEDHPKGQEYAHLLKGAKKYPVVIDSDDNVASFPPIINSDYTGKVTEKTKNLFIEVTGMDLETIKVALNVIVAALADRGAKIESIDVKYPDKKVVTPDFTPKKITVDKKYLSWLSGLELKDSELKLLLQKARYNVKSINAKELIVEYPAYRADIMHPADVVEDLIISYGYNNIEPIIPILPTEGELDEFEEFCEKIREHLAGTGATELLTFTLTNNKTLFEKMNTKPWGFVEIANPVSERWSTIRNWIIPSLLEFMEKNQSVEYPQQVYEVGDAVVIDEKAETKTKCIKRLAWALADKNATFTNAKQVLDVVLDGLDLKYEIEETEHDSFIPGRVGRVIVNNVKVAFIGEIHPKVIENFGIKMPVVVIELNLTDLYSTL